MLNHPFFSIIIPTYNSSEVLEVAINSIIKQTYKNYEIVIIDGGSNDGTLDLLKNYVLKYPNSIRFKSEKDKGIYDAMNKGINFSEGEWLFFLGSDDYFYSATVFQELHSFIKNNPCEVVYGDINGVRFNGRRSGNFSLTDLITRNLCHQGIFFNKKVFSKIGVFDLKYKAHADWDHNMRWFFNPKINKKYIPLIISEYADGGFSSLHGDPVFESDKDYKIVKYGWKSLPPETILYRAHAIFKNKSLNLSTRLTAFRCWFFVQIRKRL
ncbi:glycosyltransferase [Formosa sediminum]|uniref:Glycosyltransferase n=1 Tax=Formosa sediminum TaxID=2594004 RepID=A0A516GQB3_9FLAO|nr:glycosyltransferase family 2 protein [Formosa sediminum]QDO93683.1 glycosyltransferase [Formosa sediminum]